MPHPSHGMGMRLLLSGANLLRNVYYTTRTDVLIIHRMQCVSLFSLIGKITACLDRDECGVREKVRGRR